LLVSGVFVVAACAGNLAGVANPFDSYGFNAVAGLAFTFMGGLIVPRHARNLAGWLFVLIGLANAVVAVSASYGQWRPMAWVQQWTLPLPVGMIALLLLVFPDGRYVSKRWRVATWILVLGMLSAAASIAIVSWNIPQFLLNWDVARTFHGPVLAVVAAGWLLIVAGLISALVSLIIRWRHASGVVREQLKVLALGGGATAVGLVLEFAAGIPWLWPVLGAVIPLSAGAAMLHYRLYDADLVLNRSLVYAVLTLTLLGAYAATVTALGMVFSNERTRLSPLVATGIVAVLFQPLRARVQRAINRLLYGSRDDPNAVLVRLSRGLESAGDPTAVLPRVVRTVADALRLPYIAIEITKGDHTEIAASHGRHGLPTEAFPMVYQGQQVGRLVAAPRTMSETLTSAERRLLQDLATQAVMVVHASQLTRDLRRSRERLVRSREEERRRLRRDLHDGLGPALAGMAMQVGAAQALLTGSTTEVEDLLVGLEKQLQASVTEIRRLVDDLRPPTLDELGLLGAIRQRLEAFASGSPTPKITVAGSEQAGELPAAVEVAAYRIALEAVTNVVRHASATWCQVEIAVDTSVVIEVTDDGVGLTGTDSIGVGLSSMRERAEELGGTFTAVSREGGGTYVRAELPA
jgi:signal transduction histidine kinase